MANTADEIKADNLHEKRMHEDFSYAVQFTSESVFGDLEGFAEFIEEHEMLPIILREFNRALCNSPVASLPIGSYSDMKRNNAILQSRMAVIDAVSNIRDEFDSKIIKQVKDKF